MALLEAASCGIPIVSTNVGEIPFIYEENESILLVDNFSITDFVSKIESIFNSLELSSKLSLNGIKVSQKYAFTEIKPLWIKQFEKFNGRYSLNSKKTGLLFIGTFLSWKKGTKGPSELVSRKLRELGYKTKIASSYENKFLRLLDIFFSILLSGEKHIHIDVFSGPSFLIAKYSVLLANFLEKKVVLNLHGGMLPEYFEMHKDICSKVFNSVIKIYTPSKYLQTYFTSMGFKMNYLPNSIDTSKFKFETTSNTYKILWVRAFTKIYQPNLAIEILEIVKKEFPQTTLTMIGPDLGLRNKIESQIKAKNLVDSVALLGTIDNDILVDYFHGHTVYLNTTLYESFGLAILESASSGLPVVTTNVGEIPYLWKDNEELLIDKTNSSLGMAECIISLFRNEEKRLNLAINAKKKAEIFSWNSVGKLWENLVDEIK
jgi:glycosyltransferase involved in cell wall biosynthesis